MRNIGDYWRDFWRNRRGASAVEAALVLPMCVFLTLGAINLALSLYAVTTLHRAVEDSARWASVYTADNMDGTGTGYPTLTQVRAHATSAYRGPGLSGLTFQYTTPATGGCGHLVTGTGTYKLITGLYSPTFTLNAAGCYP